MTVGDLVRLLGEYDKNEIVDIRYADEKTPWRVFRGEISDVREESVQKKKKLIIELVGVKNHG